MKVTRVSRVKLLSFLVGVMILSVGIVTLLGEDVPTKQPKSFSEWKSLLSKEKLSQVEMVFKKNLDCMGHLDETSQPDIKNWRKSVYKDLETILTSEEFKGFKRIMEGNFGKKLSAATTVNCTDCQSPAMHLGDALDLIEVAEESYGDYSDYCDYGLYPDQVLPLIINAESRAELAEDAAWDAYNNCDCTSAQNALYQAQQARWKVNAAIENSNTYCDPIPWKNFLLWARDSLDLAISLLSDCIDEACN
jgi:hypothetical protein